jgi:phosphoglycerate dehydrogenase-like enzyme
MRALISDGVFPGVASSIQPLIDDLELDLAIATGPEEARALLPDAQLLLVKNFDLRSRDLEAAHQLRGVQKLGMLVENIETSALESMRIPLRTMQLPSAVAVADHTLALILALTRRLFEGRLAMNVASSVPIAKTDELHYAYDWAQLSVGSLAGKSLGLIGFGEVALEVANRARSFDMRISYTKRTPLSDASERRLGLRYMPFDALLRESDVVSLHVPHTPATEGLIGAAELASMKPGALLINTARGAIVDEAAMIACVNAGHLAGVGLDVFDLEPLPPDSPLLSMPRTVLSPHVAGAGPKALALAIADSLRRWHSDLKPQM